VPTLANQVVPSFALFRSKATSPSPKVPNREKPRYKPLKRKIGKKFALSRKRRSGSHRRKLLLRMGKIIGMCSQKIVIRVILKTKNKTIYKK